MSIYIVKGGFRAMWEIVKVGTDNTPFTVAEGFGEKKIPVMFADLAPVMGEIAEEDTENPDDGDTEPTIRVYSAVNYPADTADSTKTGALKTKKGGKAQNIDPMGVGSHKGRQVIAWGEFLKMTEHSQIDPEVIDTDAVGKSDGNGGRVKIKPLAVECFAVPGRGRFGAYNGIKRWAPNLAVWAEESKLAGGALAAGLANLANKPAQTSAPVNPLINGNGSQGADKPSEGEGEGSGKKVKLGKRGQGAAPDKSA